MIIRTASMADLDSICQVENTCFPPAEAADRASFIERLRYYPNHFHLLFKDGILVSFTDGFATDERDLRDEMYEHAYLHNENGAWQMIFGVNTLPEYRNRGYAGMLIREMIAAAKKENRLGLVLTCKDALVPFYSKFGFVNEGPSASIHGNAAWNQMRLTILKSL